MHAVFLEEIKEKREREEFERQEAERVIRERNEKRWARHREIVEKYGENHEMASLCEYADRPLTPIRDIPISPPPVLSPSDSYDFDFSPVGNGTIEDEDEVEKDLEKDIVEEDEKG